MRDKRGVDGIAAEAAHVAPPAHQLGELRSESSIEARRRLLDVGDHAEGWYHAIPAPQMTSEGWALDPAASQAHLSGTGGSHMSKIRIETDSLGEVEVPADKLWGAQTQRSIEHFSIGTDLMPRQMITAYAVLKKACANANFAGKRLDGAIHKLIVRACDEILAGQHHDMFPL